MHLRLSKPSDGPAIVNICARAFMEEDLFGRVIHPYRAQYPNDVKIFWHEWVRNDWTNPRNNVIVAVSTTSYQQEHVIGVAIWQRQGDDAGAQGIIAGWTDPGRLPALPSTHNRAADPSKKEILAQAAPFTKHYWAGPCATN
ncbi:hypothetical protein J4E80_003094 [Alternaria sp. BMP 0032]|nr:hypothetical protein J4E80_003094 [Alternaria sp. BMP 0032]